MTLPQVDILLNGFGADYYNGKAYCYAAGTTSLITWYTDAGGTTPAANPITLDASGSATVYTSARIKLDVQNSTGVSAPGFPVDNIGYGIITPDEYTADSYDSIASAVASISTQQTSLYIPPGTYSITDDLTIPSTLRLNVANGAKITVSNGKTLQINGIFDAGRYYIFNGNGIVYFNGGDVAYPEWWGAEVNNSATDSSIAIQSAIDSKIDIIDLQAGTYYTKSELLINNSSITMRGKGQSNTTIRYNGTYVSGTSIIKITVSSYCLIEELKLDAWAGGADTKSEIPNSLTDYGIYITSNGNHPITQYNTISDVRVEWVRINAFTIGNVSPSIYDVNTDGNKFINCFASFCNTGFFINQTNTNMTFISNGATTSTIMYGVCISNNARGVVIERLMGFNNGIAYIYIAKENSGPVTLRNIVTELYEGCWLQVETSSSGLTSKSLLNIENCNVTNDDSTDGQKVIDYQGGGSVTIRNSRFGGAGSKRASTVGGTLTFKPANGDIGGTQWIITECVELYDAATWDIYTDQANAWMRWLDIGSTLRTGNAGEGTLPTPFIRERGRINHEIQTLSAITLASGGTINSYGHLGRSCWKITISYTAFITAALTSEYYFCTVPAKTRIIAVYADTTQAFTGLSGGTTLTIRKDGDILLSSHDIKSSATTKGLAVADLGDSLTTNLVQGAYIPNWTVASQLHALLTSASGNIGNGVTTNLTAGSVTIYVITETLPTY